MSIKKKYGFTIIEAMIAVVILAMAAAAVVVPYSSGASVQAEGHHRTQAAMLGKDLMERIVATGFDNIISNYGSFVEAKGNVTNWQGNKYDSDQYALFSRGSSCAYETLSQENGNGQVKYIKAIVVVYYDNVPICELCRLITRTTWNYNDYNGS